MSTCIMVLGTPRSGTSCVSGVLSNLGLFVGERLLPPTQMNARGFFQDAEFEELFDSCPEWMPKYPGKDLCDAGKLHALIEKRCREHEMWGVKVRLGAFIVNEVERACEVKLIVLDRDRQQSIDSLASWSLDRDQDPAQVIDRAKRAIEAACEGRDVLPVSYEKLLHSPEVEVNRIAEYAGLPPTPEAISFVQPHLRRY